jgi:hypothetical protein
MVICATKRDNRQCVLSGCGRRQARYVYALFDIRYWTVFYIGHSVNPYQRLQEHISHAIWNSRESDFPNRYNKTVYIADMLEDGIEPLLIILDAIDTDCRKEAEDLEIAYIEAFRRQGYLITGWEGEGASPFHDSSIDVYLQYQKVDNTLREMYKAVED